MVACFPKEKAGFSVTRIRPGFYTRFFGKTLAKKSTPSTIPWGRFLGKAEKICCFIWQKKRVMVKAHFSAHAETP